MASPTNDPLHGRWSTSASPCPTTCPSSPRRRINCGYTRERPADRPADRRPALRRPGRAAGRARLRADPGRPAALATAASRLKPGPALWQPHGERRNGLTSRRDGHAVQGDDSGKTLKSGGDFHTQRRPALPLRRLRRHPAPRSPGARAEANGVDLWALTDHDEIGGQQRAAAAARALGHELPDRHRDLGQLRRPHRAHRRPGLRPRRRRAAARAWRATRGGRERARHAKCPTAWPRWASPAPSRAR